MCKCSGKSLKDPGWYGYTHLEPFSSETASAQFEASSLQRAILGMLLNSWSFFAHCSLRWGPQPGGNRTLLQGPHVQEADSRAWRNPARGPHPCFAVSASGWRAGGHPKGNKGPPTTGSRKEPGPVQTAVPPATPGNLGQPWGTKTLHLSLQFSCIKIPGGTGAG